MKGRIQIRIRIKVKSRIYFRIRSKVMRIRNTIKTALAEMWVKESLRKTCLLPGEVGHSYTQQHTETQHKEIGYRHKEDRKVVV
jgi:hypothetical protein